MASSRGRRALERLARIDLRHRAARRRDTSLADIELLRAIERGELTLHFQPLSELRTGLCRRVEALVRWTHPTAGAIEPREIVRMAAATGSLVVLAQWVVTEAARRRTLWAQDGLELGVSVNLSGPELLGPGPANLLAAIAAARAPASAFTFEVPAEALLSADAPVRDGVRALGRAGARVAVDHVSPAEMPPRAMCIDLHEIKATRALVLRAVADESAATSLRAIVEAARDLGLTAVAVGVEDDATYRLVSAFGYDLAQGFWMSRPLAVRDVSRWRGWMARIALGGAAAFIAPLGFARMAIGGIGGITSLAGSGGESQCCSRDTDGNITGLGLTMTPAAVGDARLLAEAAISTEDVERLAFALERDLAASARSLGAEFERAPTVYVFATRASFAFALERGFGQSASDAGMLAAGNGGVAFPRQAAVAVSWEAIRADPTLSLMRHELTHLLVHQLAGTETELPAWLDEGIATVAEREGAVDDLADARAASATLALLTQGRASLDALSSARDWTVRNAYLDGRGYTLAAQAVQLLKRQLPVDGLRRLLTEARAMGFGAAFAAVRGESVADFVSAFPARFAMEHDAPTITQRRDGTAVRWSVSGVPRDGELTVTIDGKDYHLTFAARADGDGVYSATFGGTAKPGEYTITVSSRDAHASTTLRIG